MGYSFSLLYYCLLANTINQFKINSKFAIPPRDYFRVSHDAIVPSIANCPKISESVASVASVLSSKFQCFVSLTPQLDGACALKSKSDYPFALTAEQPLSQTAISLLSCAVPSSIRTMNMRQPASPAQPRPAIFSVRVYRARAGWMPSIETICCGCALAGAIEGASGCVSHKVSSKISVGLGCSGLSGLGGGGKWENYGTDQGSECAEPKGEGKPGPGKPLWGGKWVSCDGFGKGNLREGVVTGRLLG